MALLLRTKPGIAITNSLRRRFPVDFGAVRLTLIAAGMVTLIRSVIPERTLSAFDPAATIVTLGPVSA